MGVVKRSKSIYIKTGFDLKSNLGFVFYWGSKSITNSPSTFGNTDLFKTKGIGQYKSSFFF